MQAWRRASGMLSSWYSSASTFREAGLSHGLSRSSAAYRAGSSRLRKPSPFTECSPHHGFRSTAASFGVMDNMRSAYDTAMQNSEVRREAKVFAAQMKYLTAEQRVDGDVFLQMLEDIKVASGLGGMKEHLPWVQNNPALGEFKRQEEALLALTPAERANIFAVGIGGIKRVAKQTGIEVHAVESLLRQIKTLVGIQKWMRNRVKEGLILPETGKEMQIMLQEPGSGMSRKPGRDRRIKPGIQGGTTARRKLL